jgi:glycolate oxidase
MLEQQKTNTLDYFTQLLGQSNVLLQGFPGFEDYLKDMADYESQPLVVLQPNNSDQVSHILSYANENRIPVVARGAGTSLTGASSSHGGITVDFSKHMKNILKIDTINWYVHCEAGVVLEDLNQELRKEGFFFPPDPASTAWCTVGGAVSENSGGMRCFRYGTVKDWVLALKVILADGTIVKLGEPLPKNRVGYDLVHLVCGSEGTLCLVAEAWLKILPLSRKPDSHKRLLVFFDSWAPAGRAIQKLRKDRIQPILLEFMDGETMHAVNESFDLKIPEHEATLFFETDSSPEEIVKVCEESGAIGSYIATDEKDEERLYSARALAYLAVKSLGGTHTEDVVVPLDKLVDYLEFVKGVSRKHNLRIPTNGHAGDGNVHPVIIYDKSSQESSAAAERAFADICNYAIEVGGSVTGEHGIGEQKREFAEDQLERRNGKRVIELMNQLKVQWDPNNILNPGKFLNFTKSETLKQ